MTHEFLDAARSRLDFQGDHCPFIPVFGPPRVMFERGQGTRLWSIDGTPYLDFLSGISVVSLGHSHPAVAAAIAEQASTLMHVSNFFANTTAARAAIKVCELVESAGAGPGQVFFCNSGAEANEAAIKLARKFGGRGRHDVVSAYGSFHGRTLGALAMTGQTSKHEGFEPLPEGFRYVEFGDVDGMESALDATVAAVVLEVIQGEGGVIPADPDYLRRVQQMCRERGILFILDEVQTGFSRTGRWFAFEHAGLSPDAVTLAKGMGNGMPIGALWARSDVAAAFQPGDHGSTFSGTAIATAAVCAVIDEMKRIDAPQLASRAGSRLASAVDSLPGVDHVRGSGVLLGAVLEAAFDARDVARDALDRGLIVNAVNQTTLRLAPPVNVSDAEIDEAVTILAEVLS